jgi:hypothetical protein
MEFGVKKEFNLKSVEILQDAFYGTGSDIIGGFHVEGNIFPNRSVVFKKEYLSHSSVYEGEFNESFTMISGYWHNNTDIISSETFEIRL